MTKPATKREIDAILARRPALDDKPTRVDKILHALKIAAERVEEARAPLDAMGNGTMSEWQPIGTAPKTKRRIWLAHFGWSSMTPRTAFSAETDEKVYELWWAVSGFWSDRWNNWNDGVEPCGLASPTHWAHMPLLAPPEPILPNPPQGSRPCDGRW